MGIGGVFLTVSETPASVVDRVLLEHEKTRGHEFVMPSGF